MASSVTLLMPTTGEGEGEDGGASSSSSMASCARRRRPRPARGSGPAGPRHVATCQHVRHRVEEVVHVAIGDNQWPELVTRDGEREDEIKSGIDGASDL